MSVIQVTTPVFTVQTVSGTIHSAVWMCPSMEGRFGRCLWLGIGSDWTSDMFLPLQQHQHPILLHCHQFLRPHPADQRQPSSSVTGALLQATIQVDESGILKRKNRHGYLKLYGKMMQRRSVTCEEPSFQPYYASWNGSSVTTCQETRRHNP